MPVFAMLKIDPCIQTDGVLDDVSQESGRDLNTSRCLTKRRHDIKRIKIAGACVVVAASGTGFVSAADASK